MHKQLLVPVALTAIEQCNFLLNQDTFVQLLSDRLIGRFKLSSRRINSIAKGEKVVLPPPLSIYTTHKGKQISALGVYGDKIEENAFSF
jgi:hypothetical protein